MDIKGPRASLGLPCPPSQHPEREPLEKLGVVGMGVQAAEAGLSQGGQKQIQSPGNSVWTPRERGLPSPECHDHPQLLLGGPRGWRGPAGEEPREEGAEGPLLGLG